MAKAPPVKNVVDCQTFWRVRFRLRGVSVSQSFAHTGQADDRKRAYLDACQFAMAERSKILGEGVSTLDTDLLTLHEIVNAYQDSERLAKQKSGSKTKSQFEVIKATLGELLDKPYKPITRNEIAQWIETLKKTKSNATINRYLAVLSAAIKFVSKDDRFTWLADENKFLGNNLKTNNAIGKTISEIEFDAIVESVEGEESKIVIQLLMELFCRRGEIAKLRWEDVNLETKRVIFRDTKNGETRTMFLSPRAIQLLMELGVKKTGNVISIKDDSITQAFDRALLRLQKIDGDNKWLGFRLHDIRGTGAGRIAHKVEAHELAKLGGWKSLDLIIKRYYRITDRTLEKLGW
jgi:integrase